jgi:tubulin beta
MRFPGISNNSDIRKLSTNLIPFPRVHFITQGQAPLVARASTSYITLDEKQLTCDLFDPRSFICETNPAHGKFLTGSILIRGESVSAGEVERQLAALSDKRSSQFVEWIPNRLMNSICSVAPPFKTASMSGTSLFNATSISETMRRVLENFQKMFRKKAFLHQYTEEGMDL